MPFLNEGVYRPLHGPLWNSHHPLNLITGWATVKPFSELARVFWSIVLQQNGFRPTHYHNHILLLAWWSFSVVLCYFYARCNVTDTFQNVFVSSVHGVVYQKFWGSSRCFLEKLTKAFMSLYVWAPSALQGWYLEENPWVQNPRTSPNFVLPPRRCSARPPVGLPAFRHGDWWISHFKLLLQYVLVIHFTWAMLSLQFCI